MEAMQAQMKRLQIFACPFLRAGEAVVAQTALILHFLGPKLGLAPKDEKGRLWLLQQQLTVADWAAEVHETHHPLGPTLYYKDQKPEAKRRTAEFLKERLPKYLGYFETLRRPRETTYLDLSLFQMVEGLRYAFPKWSKKNQDTYPKLIALHDKVAARPRLMEYLSSERRLGFNQDDLFRHYPELDA
jgi:glutathione S-transferase